ncbi:hypothetical protein [Lyticum sinuosum]|uniref:Flagellar hook-associated protein FlgL n=1 Tax=Lyticum sinuosum TaxID=1332059 RepID=A0AAE4VL01_9RICK|nr:hypothetical protein [Lyticum sinuosum]MDZ5760987.1 putative flagellar hook-associated protein FlgL [Lyticum sinuosum]
MGSTIVQYNNITRTIEGINKNMNKAIQKASGQDGVEIKDFIDVDPMCIPKNIEMRSKADFIKNDIDEKEQIIFKLQKYCGYIEHLYEISNKVKNLSSFYLDARGDTSFVYIKCQSLLEELVIVLNSKYGHGYAFGTSRDHPPIPGKIDRPNVNGDYTNAYYYKGNNSKKKLYLGENNFTYGINANDPSIQRLVASLTLIIDSFDKNNYSINHINNQKILQLVNDIPQRIQTLCSPPGEAINLIKNYIIDRKNELKRVIELYSSTLYNGTSDIKRQEGAVDINLISKELEVAKAITQQQMAMYNKMLNIYTNG